MAEAAPEVLKERTANAMRHRLATVDSPLGFQLMLLHATGALQHLTRRARLVASEKCNEGTAKLRRRRRRLPRAELPEGRLHEGTELLFGLIPPLVRPNAKQVRVRGRVKVERHERAVCVQVRDNLGRKRANAWAIKLTRPVQASGAHRW